VAVGECAFNCALSPTGDPPGCALAFYNLPHAPCPRIGAPFIFSCWSAYLRCHSNLPRYHHIQDQLHVFVSISSTRPSPDHICLALRSFLRLPDSTLLVYPVCCPSSSLIYDSNALTLDPLHSYLPVFARRPLLRPCTCHYTVYPYDSRSPCLSILSSTLGCSLTAIPFAGSSTCLNLHLDELVQSRQVF
jgi:hypothetical protein